MVNFSPAVTQESYDRDVRKVKGQLARAKNRYDVLDDPSGKESTAGSQKDYGGLPQEQAQPARTYDFSGRIDRDSLVSVTFVKSSGNFRRLY